MNIFVLFLKNSRPLSGRKLKRLLRGWSAILALKFFTKTKQIRYHWRLDHFETNVLSKLHPEIFVMKLSWITHDEILFKVFERQLVFANLKVRIVY